MIKEIFCLFDREIKLFCFYVLHYWLGVETDSKTDVSYVQPAWNVLQQDSLDLYAVLSVRENKTAEDIRPDF